MKITNVKYLVISTGVAGLSLLLGACNGSSNNSNNNGNPAQPGQGVPAPTPGMQIDRLARPAINEGLSVTDTSLNAFNSIPPSADLSPAAAPVLAEDSNTLTAFANLGKALSTTPAPSVASVVGAFIPDVMRIDTRLSIPPGTTAYNAATSGSLGMLTGGRKLEDDTIDITLSFLVAGDATGQTVKDNVSYAGVAGNPNQPGHRLLHGQTARLGSATFPFEATPN